jgi:hypothetical protein
MNKRLLRFAMVPALLFTGIAIAQQYPIMDMMADNLVQKYQQSSCEQLWHERAEKQGKPKSEREQEAVQMLRDDPQSATRSGQARLTRRSHKLRRRNAPPQPPNPESRVGARACPRIDDAVPPSLRPGYSLLKARSPH